jgi:hypothetical protein
MTSTTTNGQGRRISVKDATVKTATVGVRSLVISGKQVTLAVFRQLQEEPLLDEDTLQLRGLPWGTVNYHWKDCCLAGEHLWVVWQTGAELRRASVARGWVPPRQAGCRRLIKALGGLRALVASLDSRPSAVDTPRYGQCGVTVGEAFFPTDYETAAAVRDAWCLPGAYRPDSDKTELYEWERNRLGELVATAAPAAGIAVPAVATAPERREAIALLAGLWQARVDEDAAITAQLTVRYRELSALDQLFIAI